MSEQGLRLLAAVASAVAVGALARFIVRPTARLGPRLRPFTVSSRVSLGEGAGLGGGAHPTTVRPLTRSMADRLGRLVDGVGDDAMLLKLRQAGLIALSGSEDRLADYRMRQFLAALGWTVASGTTGVLLGLRAGLVLLLAGGGFVVGITRWRARLDRAIERRIGRMNTEIYTVDQLL
ncbi:MAG TPA: hypothetical protein VIL12_04580, partial [Acidimicrobiia bacterium]